MKYIVKVNIGYPNLMSKICQSDIYLLRLSFMCYSVKYKGVESANNNSTFFSIKLSVKGWNKI